MTNKIDNDLNYNELQQRVLGLALENHELRLENEKLEINDGARMGEIVKLKLQIELLKCCGNCVNQSCGFDFNVCQGCTRNRHTRKKNHIEDRWETVI